VQGTYTWVKGGNEGLKEALYSVGPMTVSVDAAADDFAFYRSGIYNNTKCATKLKGLDHAVLISGYGTTLDGRDYWLVKNTWSTLWGEGGYIRIARDPDDCGIASQPLYVDLEIPDA
jgi:C1A family cysteine protease